MVVENAQDKQLMNKIDDIERHPDKHLHNYDGLFECCLHDGTLNSKLLDAHSREV